MPWISRYGNGAAFLKIGTTFDVLCMSVFRLIRTWYIQHILKHWNKRTTFRHQKCSKFLNKMSGVSPLEVWRKIFRVTRENFLELVEMIRPYNRERSETARQNIITLEKRIAMTLHYLKDQGSVVITANVFGCSMSSTSDVVEEVCRILSKNIASCMIKYPSSKAEVEKTNWEFLQKLGFPRVLGYIDGTHIPISEPRENPHDYFSYKMKYKINVQAIGNCNGRFTDVDIKWPGSLHGARVFANSEVQKGYTNEKFKLYYEEFLPGDKLIPQILLGDPVYPLLPYVMKEYAVCQSNNEFMFSTMLRSARNQIECAFGRLKARWRILRRFEDIPDIVLACFVLHTSARNEILNQF